jgi:hypothetical protein
MKAKAQNSILEILNCEPLSSCLRKAGHLAYEAGVKELERWLRLELGGYYNSNSAMEKSTVVPEYRTVAGEHADVFGRTLVVPADLSFVNETRLRNGVEELESLMASRNTVMIHDPDMCELIRKHLNIEVYSFRFSTIHLKGVLSAIRTEVETKLRKLKLTTIHEKSTSTGDEIFQLRPNFHGIGVDLRALWRSWNGPK